MRQVAGAFAEYENGRLVARRMETGKKVGGRESHIEHVFPLLSGALAPLSSLGLHKLKQELRNNRGDPSVLGDACLKEIVTLADGPVSLPESLGRIERRAKFARNIEMLASSVAVDLGIYGTHTPNEGDPVTRILRKYKHLQ
jgi:hypothetical protein